MMRGGKTLQRPTTFHDLNQKMVTEFGRISRSR